MTRYMPAQARSCRISSRFGPRDQAFHWGVNFAAADGTMIYAAQAGSVQFIGPADGFGQWIVVDHPTEAGSGTTLYAHMWDARHRSSQRRSRCRRPAHRVRRQQR